MEIEEQITQNVPLYTNEKFYHCFSNILHHFQNSKNSRIQEERYSRYSIPFIRNQETQSNFIINWNEFIKKAFENDEANNPTIITKYLQSKSKVIFKKLSELALARIFQIEPLIQLYLVICKIEIEKRKNKIEKVEKYEKIKTDLINHLDKHFLCQEKKTKYKILINKNSNLTDNYVDFLLKQIEEGMKSGDDYYREMRYQERRLLLLKKNKQTKSIPKIRIIANNIRNSDSSDIGKYQTISKKRSSNNSNAVLPYIHQTSRKKHTTIGVSRVMVRNLSQQFINKNYLDKSVYCNFLSKRDLYY